MMFPHGAFDLQSLDLVSVIVYCISQDFYDCPPVVVV